MVEDDDDDDFSCTNDEDELERAELRRLQRQIEDQNPLESQEERDYKEEFFELLDEVFYTFSENSKHYATSHNISGFVSFGKV